MAEDDSSREELRRLDERLEHIEQLLQIHTERLYQVELRLGIDYRRARRPPEPARRRPLYESIKDERDEVAATPPPTQDAARSETTTPPPAPDARPHAQERPAHGEQQPPTQARPPRAAGGASESAGGPSAAGTSSAAGAAAGGERARDGRGAGVLFGSSVYGTGGGGVRAEEPRRTRDLESLVGGSWFNWLGIIALTVAVAFFLRHAFEKAWIGPTARVALGGLAGAAVLALAERLRARGYRQYAYVLSGGGVLILYLSTYAARAFYDLISQPAAFVLMSAVTALAVALAVRHDARAIAVLGLIGGFATPVLLSTGEDHQVAFFTYLALLDAGVLAVAYFKQWRILNFLSFFATVVMFVGWAEQHYVPSKLWTTVFFLTLFFLLFSAVAPVHNVLRQRPARWHDILLVIANATFYFSASYALIDQAGYGAGLGSFALTVSALYVLLFYLVWSRHRADLLLRYSYAGAAVTFFTMAVAIQLDWHWVTIGWATEGLMLLWVGLRARDVAPRHAALGVFAAAVGHWFMWDMNHSAFRPDGVFVPLLNARAFSCAALVAALAGGAWLYRRAGDEVNERERASASTFYTLAASGLGFVLLTLDLNDFFNQRAFRQGLDVGTGSRRALENSRQFSLTALWAFYGAAALALGLLRRMRLLRYGALVLLLFTVLKLAAVDAFYYAAAWHVPVFNQTFMAFALTAAALVAGARLYARDAAGAPAAERDALTPALTLLANLLMVAALSLEAAGYFDRAIAAATADTAAPGADEVGRLENNKWFAVSWVWIVYGAGAFVYGARRRSRAVRYGALVLLVAAAVKVLLQDITFYAAPWHVPLFNQTFAAFALLVAALALVVRHYGRAEDVDEEERAAVPFLIVAANLLAVVALSAEASGHFTALIRETLDRGGAGMSERLRDLRLAESLALSVVWAVYGGGMLAYGHLRGNKLLRLLALGLLVLTTLKVFFWDLASLERIYRIISFVVLGLILLAVSYVYQKRQRTSAEEEAAAHAAGEAGGTKDVGAEPPP